MEENDLSELCWDVLTHLMQNGPSNWNDITRDLCITLSDSREVFSRLEEDGYIRKDGSVYRVDYPAICHRIEGGASISGFLRYLADNGKRLEESKRSKFIEDDDEYVDFCSEKRDRSDPFATVVKKHWSRYLATCPDSPKCLRDMHCYVASMLASLGISRFSYNRVVFSVSELELMSKIADLVDRGCAENLFIGVDVNAVRTLGADDVHMPYDRTCVEEIVHEIFCCRQYLMDKVAYEAYADDTIDASASILYKEYAGSLRHYVHFRLGRLPLPIEDLCGLSEDERALLAKVLKRIEISRNHGFDPDEMH